MPRGRTATLVQSAKNANDRAADAPAEEAEKPAETETPLEDYELRRQALLAKLPPKDERPQTLIGKLALVAGLVGTIPKRGTNKFHGYSYATEGDLVEAIRPLLSELGVWIRMSLVWDPSAGIIGHQRVKIGEHAEVDSLTILMVGFEFVNADSRVVETAPDGSTRWSYEKTPMTVFPGYGDDTGDKGAYKALTGAEKYFLMKSFLVATGDDPEADSRADDRAAARDAATKVKVEAGPRGQRPARHGGRQAESSGAQVRVLGEALRAAGYNTTGGAIDALMRLTGKTIEVPDPDQAGAILQAFIKGMSADEVGDVIRKLKELPEAVAQDAAAEEPDAGPEPDGGTEMIKVDSTDDSTDAGPYA